MKQSHLLLGLFTFYQLINTANAGSFFSPDVAPQLNDAQHAYAVGDYATMVSGVKNALLKFPNDPLVKDNAMKLWTAANRLNASLPADWHLPKDILKMKITVRHGLSEGLHYYSIKVGGLMNTVGELKQLKVVRYADQSVILDKQAGIGSFQDMNPIDTSKAEYNCDSHKNHTPVPTGLYLLSAELTNGDRLDNAWFIVDEDMNSTTVPEVVSPAVGETFSTPNPTFRYPDFRTPQYQPSETRSSWQAVSNLNWNEVWGFGEQSPSREQITVGVPMKDAEGVSKLDPGVYYYTLAFLERRPFGDVMIGRMAANTRSFTVK